MIEIVLDAYLDKLKSEEKYKREGERRAVPTYVDLAGESGISPVTLSRITNGHVKQLKLTILNSIITSLRKSGFPTELSDLLVYHPDGSRDADLPNSTERLAEIN